MRFIGILIATVLAFSSNVARADYFFPGPPSGFWQTYQVEFAGPPLDFFSLSFFIRNYTCFNGLPDEPYICTDSDMQDACHAMLTCPEPFIRRASFTETGVDFAFYTPRSYYSACTDFPPPGRESQRCGEIWETPALYLNFDSANSVVTVIEGPGGAVPEPASWALMIAGFALAGAALRRQKAAVAFA